MAKVTSNKNLSASDIEYINKAQAYQSGQAYTPSATVDQSYWSSSGGGGKNALHNTTTSYKATGWTGTDLDAVRNYVQQYEAQQAAAQLEQAKAQAQQEAQANMQNYIQSALAPIQSMMSQQQSQQNSALQQAQALTNEQINSAYDQSARDYYRLYKTHQKTLPENLSKAGVTGGASESSQLKLMNSYSDNLYKNEAARNNQLAGNNADYNNKVAQNSVAYANQLSNAYLQMAQQAYSYQQKQQQAQLEAQAKAEQAAAEQQAAAEVAQWNSNVQTAMQKRLAQGKTIWTWTDDDGKIHWTVDEAKGLTMGGKKLTPSSARQVSGGYVYDDESDTPSTTTGGSSAYGNSDYNSVLAQAKLRILNPSSTGGLATSYINGAEAAVKYINSSSLTDAQKNKMYKELGLV